MRMINTAAKDAAAVVSRMREFYRKRDGGGLSRLRISTTL